LRNSFLRQSAEKNPEDQESSMHYPQITQMRADFLFRVRAVVISYLCLSATFADKRNTQEIKSL
jgi:hypothetical protein